MDPLSLSVRQVAPTDPAVSPLIDRHLKLMRASSPACSIHAMEAADLADTGAVFLAAFDGERAVAMGALKEVARGHGELKSMHVLEALRGQGLAGVILAHLLNEARARGMERVSLETGSQPVFEPARAFYRRHGFADCAPFEGYVLDPNSTFMTREL